MHHCVIEQLERRQLFAGVSTGFQGSSIVPQTGLFSVELEATPTADNMDGVVGFALGWQGDRGGIAAMARFNPSGAIDVRNGAGMMADTAFHYSAGQTYRFRFDINIPQSTYSVWVTDANGVIAQLAANYAFRTGTAGLPRLNFAVDEGRGGDVIVDHVLVEKSDGVSRFALPKVNRLYQGVFPGGSNTWEADITPDQVTAYEAAAGQPVSWVYFSDNWFDGQSRAFPTESANWIRARGSIPYIRLVTTSQPIRPATGADPVFSLQNIINGQFDADFRTWAQGAVAYGGPVMLEWGTEANGDWFNWNGRWNGGGTTNGFGDPNVADGPERFVAAYKHMVQVMRDAGAKNVSWVWHVNWAGEPGDAWNAIKNYYPGDKYVDLVGISAYGPLRPTQGYSGSFRGEMDSAYAQVEAVAPEKPVIVAEFGAAANNPNLSQTDFARSALDDLFAKRWGNMVGFSWWNEHWQNGSDPSWDYTVDTTMRLQDSPDLAQVFKTELSDHLSLLQRRPRVV